MVEVLMKNYDGEVLVGCHWGLDLGKQMILNDLTVRRDRIYLYITQEMDNPLLIFLMGSKICHIYIKKIKILHFLPECHISLNTKYEDDIELLKSLKVLCFLSLTILWYLITPW